MSTKPRFRSITRIEANARGFDGVPIKTDEDHIIARQLFAIYPGADVVDITCSRWNSSSVRYCPAPHHIIYVKPSNEKWGRRPRRYVGEM